MAASQRLLNQECCSETHSAPPSLLGPEMLEATWHGSSSSPQAKGGPKSSRSTQRESPPRSGSTEKGSAGLPAGAQIGPGLLLVQSKANGQGRDTVLTLETLFGLRPEAPASSVRGIDVYIYIYIYMYIYIYKRLFNS